MERKKVKIQESFKGPLEDTYILRFDIQSDKYPTEPLLHTHSRFLYILEGQGKIKIQNKIYDLTPGAVISILPWQISEIIEVTEQLTYYLLVYNFNLINIYVKNEFNVDNENVSFVNYFYNNNSIIKSNTSAKIKSIFDDIKDEVGICSVNIGNENKKYSSIYLMSKLAELLIIYLRDVSLDETPVENKHDIENVFMYMFLNCSKDLSLKLLSKVFLMSESSISKYISEVCGMGFYDLLHEMRLFKAKFLLVHTNLSLKDIAQTLNYTDPGQLSKIFYEKYGIGTKNFKKINDCLESLVNIRLDERSLKIIDYIYDNYSENIDILQVSELFNISPKNINNILIYYIEKNFYSFLNQIRIYKACDMLVETNYSIMEISDMVGYNSTKTFTRNFIKLISITPSEFRNTYQL